MTSIFINVFNLSIAASWLIAAVFLARLLIKRKAPGWVCCLLWGFVAIRLMIPFTIESNFSLVPNQKLVVNGVADTDVSNESREEISSAVSSENNDYNSPSREQPNEQSNETLDTNTDISSGKDVSENVPTNNETSKPSHVVGGTDTNNNNRPDQGANGSDKNNVGNASDKNNVGNDDVKSEVKADDSEGIAEKTANALGLVWFAGVILMLGYAIASYILLRIRISSSIPCGVGVRMSERVDSPFVLGVFSPTIYLPLGLREESERCVIEHELAHIKRGDHFMKPFWFVILALHWFNPFVWIAYVLFCRDIESACDEKVINDLDSEERKQYATALLECSINHKRFSACPVAFGEAKVKDRVKSTMGYRKPAFWIVACSVIICVVVGFLFLTTSAETHESSVDTESSVSESVLNVESSEVVESSEAEGVTSDEEPTSEPDDEIRFDENIFFDLFKATYATDDDIAKLDYKSEKEYNVMPIVITPLEDISSFCIYEIEIVDIAEYETEYDFVDVLYTVDEVKEGQSLVIELEVGDILPMNAIAFTDSYGNEFVLSYNESPIDGSMEFGLIDFTININGEDIYDESHIHSYDTSYTILEPTCTEEGYRYHICECGDFQEEIIEMTSHTYDGYICSVCGYDNEPAFVPDYLFANVVGAERGDAVFAAQGNWYYGVEGNKIYKIDKSNYKATTICELQSGTAHNINVVGDYIYFYVEEPTIKNSYIAKVRTDGKKFEKLRTVGKACEMLVVDYTIYFTRVDDAGTIPLYCMHVDGSNFMQKNHGDVKNLISDGTNLYFIYDSSPSDDSNLCSIYKHKVGYTYNMPIVIGYKKIEYEAITNCIALYDDTFNGGGTQYLYVVEKASDGSGYKFVSLYWSVGGGEQWGNVYREEKFDLPKEPENIFYTFGYFYYYADGGIYRVRDKYNAYDCEFVTNATCMNLVHGWILYKQGGNVWVYEESSGYSHKVTFS